MEPVAIIGFSFRLPQGAEDEDTFWDILKTGKNVMTPWPESRVNIDAFYRSNSGLKNTVPAKGAHFLQGDPAAFDAPFFSITSKEARSMDPQQRLLLETAYRALENAGIPLERAAGTNTAVFGGCMTEDYLRIISKDPDEAPTNMATGTSPAIFANRLSWYFDLRGPSVQVDTACSSSMVATHLAVQSLQSGQTSMALVAGSNMILSPETSIYLSSMNFLSPDSQCYSFDHRANGYARGEGIVVLILKRLQDAIRDGDRVRAVIRASGSNSDGRTPGITQPSLAAQEQLIRDVYKSCKLQFKTTRYVEAHGTGTQIGDWTEATALGRVFRVSRSRSEPLYIGSLKANFGHVEGASGVAAILKCIMILEKGIIPPNALFEKLNPKINAIANNLEIPTSCIEWPTEGLRRVSVNSFGFGGSNGHIIIDDAWNTLNAMAIHGNRRTLTLLATPATQSASPTGNTGRRDSIHVHVQPDAVQSDNACSHEQFDAALPEYQLLVWSAKDEMALARMLTQFHQQTEPRIHGSKNGLRELAYTLTARRSVLTWRSFAVATAASPTEAWKLQPSKGTRPPRERAIAFVFTGQGAQYAKMGLELLRYPVFQSILERSGSIFQKLGAGWSLLDELRDGKRIDMPELSQPVCTAVQIALIELLSSFGIVPDVVLGHSSGEIAAAYAAGSFSFESACKIAYYRGKLVGQLAATSSHPTAMLSVNLPEQGVEAYLRKCGLQLNMQIACINSPSNVTLSGDEAGINQLKEHLDRDQIFAQKLKTGVAYHSKAMEPIAEEYLRCLGQLDPPDVCNRGAFMISSVTGQRIGTASLAQGQYWVDNLTSQVRFADALQYLVLAAPKVDGIGTISDFVEIGPHGALRRPLHDTVNQAIGGQAFKYISALSKFESASKTILNLVGHLFVRGYPVSMTAAIQQDVGSPFLVDLPQYPFDHSQLYWHETRLSMDWRLREAVPREVLGTRATDWNPLQPRWRKTLSIDEMPWIADHVIGDTILFPATGTMVMALEAVKQVAQRNKTISAFRIQEAVFAKPIIVHREEKTEIVTQLRTLQNSYEKASSRFEIQVFSYVNHYCNECFKATIHVLYEDVKTQVDFGFEAEAHARALALEYAQAKNASCRRVSKEDFYAWMHKQGLKYGSSFSLADDICWDGHERATALIAVGPPKEPFSGVVHPAVFDAACQVAYTAPSQGISKPLPTIIPHRIRDAWISATGWQPPSATHLRVMTASQLKSVGTGIETSVIIMAHDDSPVCHIKHFELLPVLDNDSDSSQQPSLLYHLKWKPQLSLMSSDTLHEYCNAALVPEHERSATDFHTELSRALLSVLSKTRNGLLENDWQSASPYLAVYADWIKLQVDGIGLQSAQRIGIGDIDEASLTDSLEALKTAKPAWRLFTDVAQNLASILRGEMDIQEFLASTGAIQDFHNNLLSIICNSRLSCYLELLVHENPGLRLLEIGAGWDSMTTFILNTLKQMEDDTGGAAFSEYVYSSTTDTSLDAVRERFKNDAGRLSFKILDPDHDINSQGIQQGVYDVVVMSNVLHSSKNISSNLHNIRKALKTGGHIIFYDITPHDSFLMDFAFGTMSGWWSNSRDGPAQGPIMTETEWHTVLQNNGFSGNDLVIRDFQDDLTHCGSIIISTAIPTSLPVTVASKVVWVINENDDFQKSLASSTTTGISHFPKCKSQICGLTAGETAADIGPDDCVVFLADFGKSILADTSNSSFRVVKSWVQRAKNLLWVTCSQPPGTPFEAQDIYAAMKDGLLRTIRAESSEKNIVSLSLELDSLDTVTHIKQIAEVLDRAFLNPGTSTDVEYRVCKGHIVTPRLVQDVRTNAELSASIYPEVLTTPWLQGPALKLDMGTRGQMDTLHFREDDDYPENMGAFEVEIEAKAWAVNFRDMFGALGRLDEDFDFGSDCAGIVTRTGSQCTLVQPGDRVCMSVFGCMRSYPRSIEWAVAKIPDHLTFEESCAVLNPGCTAWQALVEIARLRKGEKILIHSAAGATGQLAIQIAQLMGAEVFATVGYDHKKRLLVEQYNIPEDHIFYSRNVTFASGIMRVTQGYGVDVVLNSLVGEGLRMSWECIAPYGRFIEIGKADISANSSLPMSCFAKNVSFAAVDILHLFKHRQDDAELLMRKTIELVSEGRISHPKPLHIYPVSAVEDAFRFLQSGKNTGRIIIRVDPSTPVQKHLVRRRTWSFSKDASYIVAGGFGGIGRAVLKWLARRGAKHLIVPSRSGATSGEAAETVSQLAAQGVTVIASRCDVSSLDALSQLLDKLKGTMPPIRGCINASMVLQDATFDNMTNEQWVSTIKSKVPSSWNLHCLLPHLDFFLLLSSASGIVGNPGQANYAAGCSFQDSLARYRAQNGQKAVSIDLGPMEAIGVVAETKSLQRRFERSQSFVLVKEIELLSLLDMYCDPERQFSTADSQVTLGLSTPTSMRARRLEIPGFLQTPLFSFFRGHGNSPHSSGSADRFSAGELFRQAESTELRTALVVRALSEKLAGALSMKVDDIDVDQPVHAFGVDSLVAVELRNWIAKEFGADIAVFEITGGRTVAAIGELVTKTSQNELAG